MINFTEGFIKDFLGTHRLDEFGDYKIIITIILSITD